MNLVEIFARQASERSDQAAIIDTSGGRPRITTFGKLDNHSARAAALLRNHGLGPGDVALVYLPMGLELYEALLAIFRLGMTALFLEPGATPEEIEACCARMPPQAFIAVPRAHGLRIRSKTIRSISRKYVTGFPLPGACRWSRAGALPPWNPIHGAGENDPALITFTSGSTGQPKAAVRTHGFLLAQHRVLERNLALESGEVDLTTLPIFLLANLATGVTSVIPNIGCRRSGRTQPHRVMDQIQRHHITRCAASPAFFERLLRVETSRPGRLRSLRKVFIGGAPVFPGLLQALARAAPQAEVEAVYGSTEAEPIAHLRFSRTTLEDLQAMVRGAGLLAGHPIREIHVRVMRDQWGTPLETMSEQAFQSNCQPRDHPGEIVVCGDHVLPGYLHGRGDEETKFQVAGRIWHRTGDAGRLDEQGRLWLLGRCAAKISDPRGVLWPLAVESAALEQKPIERVALVQCKGKRLLALQRPTSYSGSLSELRLRILDSLAWAQLDDCVILPKIPVDRRHHSKIDYPALIRLLDHEI